MFHVKALSEPKSIQCTQGNGEGDTANSNVTLKCVGFLGSGSGVGASNLILCQNREVTDLFSTLCYLNAEI